ncbi:MAG: hypothetical protein MUC85_04290 [Anaerolineales bacterium]|jgi:hypothetical protein|nr:hypothetical protein [Anaerolineales bacterium]
MNTKHFWIACLSGATLSLLVSNLPYIGFVNCLLCSGFWGSALFATWLYRRLNGTLTLQQGVKIGTLTGVLAGLIGFALSFVGLAGLQGFLNTAQMLLPAEELGDMQEFPAWGEILFNLMGVLIEIAFGALGGWIGGTIFNPDRKKGILK